MWQKQIAVLLICIIVQGTAANLFSEDEGVVVDDSHAPAWEQHRISPHLFAAPEEEETERYTCKSIVAIAYSRRQSSGRKSDAVKQGQRTLRKRDKTTDESSDTGEEEDHQEEGFSCELEDGSNAPIEATPEQLDEMRAALTNGTLISAVSTMDVDLVDVVDGDEQVDVGAGEDTPPKDHSKSAKLPPGPIHLSTDSRRLVEHRQRRLNILRGSKKLLVIRVTDSDGKAPSGDAAYFSNKFFGTNGDKETPKAQIYGCSAGAMDLTWDFGEGLNKKMTAKGVLDVTIKSSLKKITTDTAWVEARAEAEKILGCKVPSGCGFHFVAFLLEGCYKDSNCQWAAYAYIHWWPSVFIDDKDAKPVTNYATHPSIVTHELGHNLNMAHSGRDGLTYRDHSCAMGNPHWEDHKDKQCFNPAKNFYIASQNGWYDKQYVFTLDMDLNDPYRAFRLVGVAEYGKIANYATEKDIAVVLKLETGSDQDYFIGFNRKTGQNADNNLASDEVTIIKAGANGFGYSQSWFEEGLAEGKSYSFGDWRKTKEKLVLKVTHIDTTQEPGYADVELVLGDAVPPPTPAPSTAHPTRSTSPSRAPIISPSMAPSMSPSLMPSTSPSDSPSLPPGKSPTKNFTTKIKNGNQKAKGVMYTMKADTGDVKIETIAFRVKDNKEAEVQIYFRLGSYETFPDKGMDVTDWGASVYNGIPEETPNGLREAVLNDVLTIPNGHMASIYLVGKKEFMFEEGQQEFAVAENAGDFEIFTGIATKKEFEQVVSSADFVGGITYYTYTVAAKVTSNPSFSPTRVTSSPSSTPSLSKLPTLPPNEDTSSPTMVPSAVPSLSPSENDAGGGGDGTPKTYTTPDVNKAGDNTKGVMFSITAKSKLTITGLGLLGKDAKESDLLIYYQHGSYQEDFDALDKDEWIEVFNDKVMLDPDDLVDIDLTDHNISIPAGETVSLYVLSKKGIMYTKSSNDEFDIYGGNDDLAVRVGTTTKKEFQQPEKLAEFAGRITYQT